MKSATDLGAPDDSPASARPVLLVFAILLVGLVLSTVAIVGVAAQRSTANAVDQLWEDSSNQLLARVLLHVRTIYGPAAEFARYSETAVRTRRLDPRDPEALFDHLEASIEAHPTIVWASFATPAGDYFSVYRWPVGERWEVRRTHRVIEGEQTWFREDTRQPDLSWLQTRNERSTKYDPREKNWFKSGRDAAQGHGQWNPPSLFFSRKQLGMIYSMPAFEPESHSLLGVWAAEFEAGPVVDYLANLETSPGTRIYVTTDDGTVVSRPDGPLVGEQSLLTAETSGDELLIEVWRAIQSGAATEGKPFELAKHVALFRKMPVESGLPWQVVVTVPTSALLEDAQGQARLAIAVGIVGVLLSLLLTIAATIALNRVIRSRVKEAIARTKVGQYTLESKLGSGGMGDVYFAQHAMLRRPTAVKLLRPDMSSVADIRRFEHEVQVTCRLSHPNTVTIFDYGRTPDGRFYYAMEFIDGATLADLLRFAGPLPAGRVIFLAEQICSALQEAHEVGLVHRDIKPANLLVTALGGEGDFIKVVDFGLVKDVQTTDQGLTEEGSFAGTPGFLAPEVPVSPQMVGPVTDIYSVGAVMYVLLTGESAYEGTSGMAVFLNQQTTDPEPPSTRVNLPIPADLEAVVMRCLARKPAERPPTAAALRGELLACAAAGSWTQANANAWWHESGDALRQMVQDRRTNPESPTLVSDLPSTGHGSANGPDTRSTT